MKKTSIILILLAMLMPLIGYSQPSINDLFFDQVSYRGAFDDQNDWTAGWANWDAQNTNYPAATQTISGEITANTTWTSDKVYLLQGFVYVVNGVTLTIQPGTIIRGDKNSKGTLIIERGAKLIAEGTANEPIVFTSNQNAGSRNYGDWGGVVLCGNAKINVPGGEAQIEGGPRSYYGGTNDNDNSGILKYVRIEFPGVPFQPDKEINGLTMGGVGKNTTIDYVQVSYSGDDAFEWFGGCLNAKHLITLGTWDDDFDTDYGFSGMVQYAVALREPTIADQSGSNAFESDNDASGSTNTPQTSAVFSNVSIFGPKKETTTSINSNYKRAMHLRRNTGIDIYNSIFIGWQDGLMIDGSACESNATNGILNIKYVTMAAMAGNYFTTASGSTFEIRPWFFTASFNNDTLSSYAPLLIRDPYNYSNPDFRLQSTSPLLNNSGFVGIDENTLSASNISLYPNPVSDFLNIHFGKNIDKVSIQILDIMGRILYNNELFNVNDDMIINTSNMPAGTYIIRFINDKDLIQKTFIKQ
jgi:hypothetical protein